MASLPFPVTSPTRSYWMNPPSDLDEYSSGTLCDSCDIAIIGSGYTGAAMAYYLMKLDPTKSIAMFEARGACSGATGRNGGHLKPDVYVSYLKFEELYGHEGAKQIFDFEYSHLEAFEAIVKEEGIDCQLRITRAMDTLMSEEQLTYALSNLQAAREAGIDVSMVTVHKNAPEASKIKDAVGALSLPAGCLSPYKFVTTLLQICITKGMKLYTHTAVNSVQSNDRTPATLNTTRGQVVASKVVYATNGYSSSLLHEFANIVTPVKGIVSSIPISMSPSIDHTWGIKWTPLINNYMMRHESSLVIGGAKEVILKHKDAWYDSYDDSTLVPEGEDYLKEFTKSQVLGFQSDSKDETQVWTGIMGYSKDFMPFIGYRPNHNNEYVNIAHNGHG